MTTPMLILAAGAARRFGRPKQLADWQGRPLVAHAVRTARAAGLRPTVVLGAYADEVTAALDARCRTVEAPDWSEGMGASIRAGVRALEVDEMERFAIWTCDQPLVTGDDLSRLDEACRGVDAAAAAYEGIVGVPACFDASLYGRLAELDGDTGARPLLRETALRVRDVEMPRAADDIDTPSDLARLRSATPAGGRS